MWTAICVSPERIMVCVSREGTETTAGRWDLYGCRPVAEGKRRTEVAATMHSAARVAGRNVVTRSGGAQKGTEGIASLHAARTRSPKCHRG
jgi:hypothetical protein